MHTSLLSRGAAILSMLALLTLPQASFAATTTIFSPGDLIKGSNPTVYYFAPDGRRYVFPNEKTYFTWYTDFSKVKQIPDGQLSTIQLGRTNVTYRPGKKMVKITTDPKVYVVDQGGILRHVGSEQLAQSLYGISWKSLIDDVPDSFFANFRVGTPIQTVSDYNPQNVMTQSTTISQDKQFDETSASITIGSVSNGFVPSTITVKKGSTVTWTNNDNMMHSVVGSWGSSTNLEYQKTYSHTFNTVGSFDYHCGIHPVMQGTVNVVN